MAAWASSTPLRHGKRRGVHQHTFFLQRRNACAKEAIVVEGELRYKDKGGKLKSVKKGKRVFFYKGEKTNDGAQL